MTTKSVSVMRGQCQNSHLRGFTVLSSLSTGYLFWKWWSNSTRVDPVSNCVCYYVSVAHSCTIIQFKTFCAHIVVSNNMRKCIASTKPNCLMRTRLLATSLIPVFNHRLLRHLHWQLWRKQKQKWTLQTKRDALCCLVGIYYAMGVVGPALAAFGSAFLLGLYTDFMTVDSTQWVHLRW